MITWVTYNSRISERMIEFGVKKGDAILLSGLDELEISGYIRDIVKENNLKVRAYNICMDHVHMILECEEQERSSIIQKLKSVSARKYNIKHGLTQKYNKGSGPLVQNHLRGQKYNYWKIINEKYLHNAIEYVLNNRIKHGLEDCNELKKIIEDIIKL